ncbi:hypothetical protein Hanom_Chr11g01061941 [Helianthus anomalus]
MLIHKSAPALEAVSLFQWGRGKVVYNSPSSDPTLALLLVGYTEYDDDDDDFNTFYPFPF